ncbi:MAG: hypothetical protein HQK54_18505, partial [Oligoflexales bacterium]|nr:hypothetical protein [Oligoflexales bacterium]
MRGALYFILLSSMAAAAVSGCEGKIRGRTATFVDFPENGPVVTANAPAALLQLSLAESGPKICSEEGCPALSSVLTSRLFGKNVSSIKSMLDSIDTRMSSFERRMAFHYVPCLEKQGVWMSLSFNNTHALNSILNCYAEYAGTAKTKNSENDGQIVFGKSATTGRFYFIDRYAPYPYGKKVSNLLVSQDLNGNVELWHATYNSTNSVGASLAYLKSTKNGGVIEFSMAGHGTIEENMPLSCGVQMKSNASYLYISGKLVSPSTPSTASCDAASSVKYCLNAKNLNAEDMSSCETNGLTTYSSPAISPSDIDLEAWES